MAEEKTAKEVMDMTIDLLNGLAEIVDDEECTPQHKVEAMSATIQICLGTLKLAKLDMDDTK